MNQWTVAVLFGGPSQEHDVSIISAQQLMDAADVRRVKIVPVYLSFDGRFLYGDSLRQLARFRPFPAGLREVVFAWSDIGPVIETRDGSWVCPIDCVLPVFHGPFGEDGRVQGMLEMLGIPTAGFSAASSALAMRKDATKSLVQSVGVKVLPHVLVHRDELKGAQAVWERVEAHLDYPLIIKPSSLGSSIGVGLAQDRASLLVHLQAALREDAFALVEPQVKNLEELNIAVMCRDKQLCFSAIERPRSTADLLDFKEKYLSSSQNRASGGGGKLGDAVAPSQGMLSLTRDINPQLAPDLVRQLHDYTAKAFSVLGRRGAPRLDFLHDRQSGELWFNEINPIPGSYGFFLWEAAQTPYLFPQLIEHLIEEALGYSIKNFGDPVPQGARLLPRN